MTGRCASTISAITRSDRPIMSFTKLKKPAIVGHFPDVTAICPTVATRNGSHGGTYEISKWRRCKGQYFDLPPGLIRSQTRSLEQGRDGIQLFVTYARDFCQRASTLCTAGGICTQNGRLGVDFLGPSTVLIRSSMCNEIGLQHFVYIELTDFAQSGLKMTALTSSCACASILRKFPGVRLQLFINS